jgi:predicted esterase
MWAHRRVAALGASAAWDFPMGHEVNAEEVRVIRRFLHERLPGR